MLSTKALKFLKECKYENKNHNERTGLIHLARELYPKSTDDLSSNKCMYNTNNTGCRGIKEYKCGNYKCHDCYWG